MVYAFYYFAIYIRNIALCDAGTWTLWEVDQKYVERFEMLCWRMMEKISWNDRVKNDKALHRTKEEGNILHTTKRRKDN